MRRKCPKKLWEKRDLGIILSLAIRNKFMRCRAAVDAATPGGFRTVEMSLPGGHVQASQVGITESAAHGQIGGHQMSFQHRPGRGKDVDERAGAAAPLSSAGHDVALTVQAHAFDGPVRAPMICAEGVQHRIRPNAVAVDDRIGAQLPEPVPSRLPGNRTTPRPDRRRSRSFGWCSGGILRRRRDPDRSEGSAPHRLR